MPLSPAAVRRYALFTAADGSLHWAAQPSDPRELPDEWVLRQLGDADLDDDHSLAHLLDEHGVIVWPFFDPALVPADRRARLAKPPSTQETRAGAWWQKRGDGRLEDARWWLKTARALAGVWSHGGTSPCAAWQAEGFLTVGDEQACWAEFTLALNIGLEAFRAHLEYRADYQLLGDEEEISVTYGLPPVGLYSAACRQIFNFIVQNETARRCENETCGRTFVHQLGGAKHGQYRSVGLRFCTPECARMETQRAYRRRKAAEKQAGKEQA